MNSQVGQDKWVCETLNYKRFGYFLDIGAFDGIQISNTYYLERYLLWDGICVEAGKDNFQNLVNNRLCKCINKAVWSSNGIVGFNENWTVGGIEQGGYEIESITIDKLLRDNNCPKDIDYISLDVEGAEYDVLTCFPFGEYKVKLWTIEHNAFSDEGVMRDKIRSLMDLNGYRLVTSPEFEDWYVDKHFN
jgi:FkbM family methyltransferase